MKTIKNRLKRAFTIVELVVVIAVIAILAAVLIPTLANLLDSAEESNDMVTVSNLNKIVAAYDTVGEIDTVNDALDGALANGYSVSALTPTSEGNVIVYDEDSKRFALITENALTTSSPNDDDIIYTDSSTTKTDWTTLTTWVFINADSYTSDECDLTNYTNSLILVGDWNGKSVTASYSVSLYDYTGNVTLKTVTVSNSTVVGTKANANSNAKTAVAKKTTDNGGTKYLTVNVKAEYLNCKVSGYEINNYSTISVSTAVVGCNFYEYGSATIYDTTAIGSNYKVTNCNTEINFSEITVYYPEGETIQSVFVDSTSRIDYNTLAAVEATSVEISASIDSDGKIIVTAEVTVDGTTTIATSTVENGTVTLELGTEKYPYLIATEDDYSKINNGGYCQLTKEITATTALTVSEGVTAILDLNELSISSSNTIAISVASGATLTINGSGTITTSSSTKKAIDNLGSLTLNNVTISGSGYGVYSSTSKTAAVTLTINGGSISSTGSHSIYVKAPKVSVEINNAEIETTCSLKNAIYNENGTVTINGVDTKIYSEKGAAIKSTKSDSSATITLNINDGSITSNNTYAIYVVKGTTINMTGGTVKSNSTATTSYGIWLASGTSATYSSTLNISGGKVISNGTYGIYVDGGNAKYEEVNISGTASIVSNATNSSYCVGVLNKKGVVNVSGGTITAENGVGIYNSASSNNELNISGGTISGNRGIENLYTMTMTSGTVEGKEIGIYIAEGTAGKVTTISGSSVVKAESADEDAWSYGIYLGSGMQLSISDSVKVSATNSANGAAGIFCVGSGDSTAYTTLTISGGTISGDIYGLTGNGSNSYTDVTISGGSITGGAVGYYHPEEGTLAITGGSITGKYAGLQICAGTVSISGGTFTATATSTEIDASSANKENKEKDGYIADGAAVSIINRSGYGTYDSSTGAASVTSVTISGGTFISADGVESIQYYCFDATNKATTWTDYATYVTISVD